MTRPLRLLALACALAAAPLAVAQAQTSPLAVGLNAGTPGLGAEVQLQLSDSFVVRGGGDFLNFDRDETYGDVAYQADLKARTAGLFADWHPLGGAFLVSGGAYLGERKFDLSATPTSPVNIGGVSFTSAQVGRFNGEVELSNVQPFAGLGFDNTFSGGGGWGFRALVGVAFSKAPDVTLTSTGGVLSSDPTFQARLRQEEAEIRDDAKGFRYFPIAQVGVTRRF